MVGQIMLTLLQRSHWDGNDAFDRTKRFPLCDFGTDHLQKNGGKKGRILK